MKAGARLLACAGFLLLLTGSGFSPAGAAVPMELREPGVQYFDDDLPDEIVLTLRGPVTIYGGRDLTGPLANLGAGAKVKVVGMMDGLLLVAANSGGNKVQGWIAQSSAPAIDPEILAKVKAAQLKRATIAKAIKEKRVIIGMSYDDVKKSLGQPAKASFREDETGRRDTWTYTKYEDQPQYQTSYDALGRAYTTVYYQRVPVGEFTVEFVQGEVTGFEDHQRTLPDGVRSTVPVPQRPAS